MKTFRIILGSIIFIHLTVAGQKDDPLPSKDPSNSTVEIVSEDSASQPVVSTTVETSPNPKERKTRKKTSTKPIDEPEMRDVFQETTSKLSETSDNEISTLPTNRTEASKVTTKSLQKSNLSIHEDLKVHSSTRSETKTESPSTHKAFIHRITTPKLIDSLQASKDGVADSNAKKQEKPPNIEHVKKTSKKSKSKAPKNSESDSDYGSLNPEDFNPEDYEVIGGESESSQDSESDSDDDDSVDDEDYDESDDSGKSSDENVDSDESKSIGEKKPKKPKKTRKQKIRQQKKERKKEKKRKEAKNQNEQSLEKVDESKERERKLEKMRLKEIKRRAYYEKMNLTYDPDKFTKRPKIKKKKVAQEALFDDPVKLKKHLEASSEEDVRSKKPRIHGRERDDRRPPRERFESDRGDRGRSSYRENYRNDRYQPSRFDRDNNRGYDRDDYYRNNRRDDRNGGYYRDNRFDRNYRDRPYRDDRDRYRNDDRGGRYGSGDVRFNRNKLYNSHDKDRNADDRYEGSSYRRDDYRRNDYRRNDRYSESSHRRSNDWRENDREGKYNKNVKTDEKDHGGGRGAKQTQDNYRDTSSKTRTLTSQEAEEVKKRLKTEVTKASKSGENPLYDK